MSSRILRIGKFFVYCFGFAFALALPILTKCEKSWVNFAECMTFGVVTYAHAHTSKFLLENLLLSDCNYILSTGSIFLRTPRYYNYIRFSHSCFQLNSKLSGWGIIYLLAKDVIVGIFAITAVWNSLDPLPLLGSPLLVVHHWTLSVDSLVKRKSSRLLDFRFRTIWGPNEE